MARHSLFPRDYQTATVLDARKWLLANPFPGAKRLYAAPTGTGKSIIEIDLADTAGAWIVTPRVEIIAGMLAKMGQNLIRSEAAVIETGLANRITTPVRLRNAMLAGRCEAPTLLVIDEVHHHTAETYQQIDALTGLCPAIGFTATPFRGTPAGTAALRKQWGTPQWVLTYPNAARLGVIAIPRCQVVPLVDDDLIEVSNGEFAVSSVSAAVCSRLGAVCGLARPWFGDRRWDMPTIFSVPSTEAARELAGLLGDSAIAVTQDTAHTARQDAFAACIACRLALVQINVISEGVDLPIRRLVDCSPTLSPVRWLQQLGRITRPGGQSEYLCTNRNLLRHAYLLEGCLPASALVEASEAFQGPGKRAAMRAVGLEAIGKLRAAELPLLDGTRGLMYQCSSVEGTTVTEYAVLVHPGKATPLWAKRTRAKGVDGVSAWYGKWQRCEVPENLSGFASVPGSPLSPKQAAWWQRSASRHGLDPQAEVTRKNFAALPVLADLRARIC